VRREKGCRGGVSVGGGVGYAERNLFMSLSLSLSLSLSVV
jgi:hypothetical protein